MRHEPNRHGEENKEICQHGHLEDELLFWPLPRPPSRDQPQKFTFHPELSSPELSSLVVRVLCAPQEPLDLLLAPACQPNPKVLADLALPPVGHNHPIPGGSINIA